MKNNCPYLDKHYKCVHKSNRGDCIYKNEKKCPIWQHSPSKIISIPRTALKGLKQLCSNGVDDE